MANYRYGFVARTLGEWEEFATNFKNTSNGWVPNLGEYIFIRNNSGEIKNYRIGDGKTLWNKLKDFDITDFIDPLTNETFQALNEEVVKINDKIGNFTNIVNFRGAFSKEEEVLNPVIGDIYLNTTNNNEYIYNKIKKGEEEIAEWVILGNSYADTRIKLPLKITTNFGYFTVNNSTGYREIKPEEFGGEQNKDLYVTFESFINKALQQKINPEIETPAAVITASGGTGEVGREYALPTATLKITSVGSYTYGPDTGITFDIGDVELKQGTNSVTNNTVMTKNSTIQLQATDSDTLYTDTAKSYTFTATASHTEGAIPVTNLGEEYPYEEGRIAAGPITIDDKTVTFSGYRKAFAGGTTAATLDSAVIRAATATKDSFSAMDTVGEALRFTATAGATKVFFAYPSKWQNSLGLKKPYFEMFGLAWAENSGFTEEENNIQVADARGTIEEVLQNPIPYKVYSWTPSGGPLTAESTEFRVYFK